MTIVDPITCNTSYCDYEFLKSLVVLVVVEV